jgi:hypothetical protein
VGAVFLLLVVVAIIAFLNASLYNDSLEAITIHDLRIGRYSWLNDGCPQPPDPERYVGVGGSSSNYVYTGTLVVKGRTYHGLFAKTMKCEWCKDTYVIATTGEIFVLDDSRRVRLLRGKTQR